MLKRNIKEAAFAAFDRAAPLVGRTGAIDRMRVKRILAVQGGGMGDLIMVMPALHGLRRSFPEASLSLMTSPAARQIIPHYPIGGMLDEVIDFDFKKVQTRFSLKAGLLLALRRKRYDLVYWPSRGEGMREECVMNLFIGARYRIGFTRGRTGAYNTVQREFSESISIRSQNIGLLEAAGFRPAPASDEFTIADGDLRRARTLLSSRLGEPGNAPLVSVHPSCAWGGSFKTWPADRYRALIRELALTAGVRVVIIGSPEERAANQGLTAGIEKVAADLSGETSIAELAALIKLSQLFIGNDSGPLHIATALGVPSIGIFGPTSSTQLVSHPERCTVVRTVLPCSPCYSHQQRFEQTCSTPRCLEGISVDEVLQAARTVMTRSIASCA